MNTITYTKNLKRLSGHIEFYLDKCTSATSFIKLHYYRYKVRIYCQLYGVLMRSFLKHINAH